MPRRGIFQIDRTMNIHNAFVCLQVQRDDLGHLVVKMFECLMNIIAKAGSMLVRGHLCRGLKRTIHP